jgi:hypothetical protein
MLLFALMIAGLSGQETAYAQPSLNRAASSEVYAAPVIRPYEPPSDFGRQVEEGDVNRPIRSRPIAGPVAVEAYPGNYEQNRSSGEVSYVAGRQSRPRLGRRPDGAAGRGVERRGRRRPPGAGSGPVGSRTVEARRGSPEPERPTRSTAPVDSVTRDGGEAVIEASINGRPVRLRLQPAGKGWTGTLSGLGRDQAVSLAHPG